MVKYLDDGIVFVYDRFICKGGFVWRLWICVRYIVVVEVGGDGLEEGI